MVSVTRQIMGNQDFPEKHKNNVLALFPMPSENAFKNSVIVNNLKFNILVTNNLNLISDADHLVLPGVGSFPDCKKGLQQIAGLYDLLTNEVINRRKKFLGIC